MDIRRNRLSRALAVGLATGIGFPALAQDVDLGNLGSGGFRIDGAAEGDSWGSSVSGAGDVNGDGLADLIVGASYADSAVVFGKVDAATVDLNSLGSFGFQIVGAGFSREVSGAGDVNGDGLADLIVGVPSASPNGDTAAGSSYVVFGKANSSTVNLDTLGTVAGSAGFRIDGGTTGERTGSSVSGGGDVNGDGLDDLIVGGLGFFDFEGTSYAVFGKADGIPINLGNLSGGGFRINGVADYDFSGDSVAGAGDVNGDGLADLIVGANGADPNGRLNAGTSYVIFGKTTGASIDLANLSNAGFRIDGAAAMDRSGTSVSGAGDVNGDGLADVIIGATFASPDSVSEAGSSYVVFGRASTTFGVSLGNLGQGGFRIDGADPFDFSGFSVSGAGDIDGDGLADLLVGAFDADANGNSSGASYVVYGKSDDATIDLNILGSLGTRGFRITGASAFDISGISVSSAGDVNGDGLADLIIGARAADPNGDSSGSSYVVFSPQTPTAAATYRGHARRGDAPRLALGTSGDGSNASHPDSRAFIDFADGLNILVAASTEQVTLNRDRGAYTSAAANVHWQLDSDRTNWSSAEVRFRYTDGELLTDDENTLQLVHSVDGNTAFTPLASSVNPQDNTISAVVDQLGYFYIGQRDEEIFADGFE